VVGSCLALRLCALSEAGARNGLAGQGSFSRQYAIRDMTPSAACAFSMVHARRESAKAGGVAAAWFVFAPPRLRVSHGLDGSQSVTSSNRPQAIHLNRR
jgi:hypothetical protein